MKWMFVKEGDVVFFEKDGERNTVDRLEMGDTFYMLKVVLATGGLEEVNMKGFDAGANAFCSLFKEDLTSRTKFHRKWQKLVSVSVDRMDIFEPDSGSSTASDDSLSPSQEVSGLNCLSAEDVRNADEKSSAIGGIQDILKKKAIGTFDVHLENLVSPRSEFKVRTVNYRHVMDLEKSFGTNNLGQRTTLVGMINENKATEEILKTPGAAVVEVLGGQHTVLALKSLYEKSLAEPFVQVTIYSLLDATLALKVGLHHNAINEASRPMTFLETVKLIRDRRPAAIMSKAEIRRWKNELMVIFGDKSLEHLEGRLQNHIALARVEEDVWTSIQKAEELYGDDLRQTLFKDMVSLPQVIQLEGLDCLLEKGIKAFRAKMRECRKQFPKRKRQKKTEENKTEENKECTNQLEIEEDNMESEDTENADPLMEEVLKLREEVEMLRKKLNGREESEDREMPDAKKAKTDEIGVGDNVMAYWSNDGNMYEAVVLNVETVYSVQYVMDKKKKKLTREHLKYPV